MVHGTGCGETRSSRKAHDRCARAKFRKRTSREERAPHPETFQFSNNFVHDFRPHEGVTTGEKTIERRVRACGMPSLVAPPTATVR